MNKTSCKPIQGFWTHALMFILRKATSKHAKRILILTTLYCRLGKLKELKEEAIDHLNDLLKLALRRDALRFPAIVQNLLWNTASFEEVVSHELSKQSLNEHDVSIVAEKLVDSIERDFRYDTKETMLKDISRLIRDTFKCETPAMAA